MLAYPGTSIAFESPERLTSTLKTLAEIDPSCKTSIARELTKRFETVRTGTSEELYAQQLKEKAIGEIVLLIEGHKSEPESIFSNEFLQLAVRDLEKTCPTKEAIAKVSKQLNISKRVVYNAVHK